MCHLSAACGCVLLMLLDDCRTSRLNEDFKVLSRHINTRLPAGVTPLPSELHTANTGKAAQRAERKAKEQGSKENAAPLYSPYLQKYLDCGIECIKNVREYYADDVWNLKFPVRAHGFWLLPDQADTASALLHGCFSLCLHVRVSPCQACKTARHTGAKHCSDAQSLPVTHMQHSSHCNPLGVMQATLKQAAQLGQVKSDTAGLKRQ